MKNTQDENDQTIDQNGSSIDNNTKQEIPEEIQDDIQNIIEAVIFASDDSITASKIREVLNIKIDTTEIRKIILDINKQLQKDRRPFEIVEIGGGFQFRTIPGYQKYLKGLFKEKAIRKLSQQALETLSIIAYKQPVSKAEIEGIRSVSTDGALKTLLERRLIKILGKSEDKPGKPIVYGTTKDFLRYFGLNKISELPKIEEIEDIAKEQEKSHIIHDTKRDSEETVTLDDETQQNQENKEEQNQDQN